MQISDEHVEAFCRDKPQSFGHIGGSGYIEALVFQSHCHHVADSVVVIDKQNSMWGVWIGESHKSPPRFALELEFG
jgi:hypothetical protein